MAERCKTPTQAEVSVPIKEGSMKLDTQQHAIGYIGYVSLALLVLQNSSLTLTMRASRLGSGTLYLATSAVVMCEAIKLVLSFLMLYQENGNCVHGMWAAIHRDILTDMNSNLHLLIPATLYTVQNNIQYYAASNLDPATFQVLYQMKIITTALVSVAMLGRSLSSTQWTSVVVLTAGIAMVQTSQGEKAGGEHQSQFMGFVAVMLACCTSALAGVYLEKLVKQTKPSVWIRNIQMATFGIIVGLCGSYTKDYDAIQKHGFLYGFEPIVWVVVLLQSFGGILIAVVVKYADNIIKGFATGLSIILSAAASVYLFGFVATPQYLLGASIVCVSVYMYSTNTPKVTCFGS